MTVFKHGNFLLSWWCWMKKFNEKLKKLQENYSLVWHLRVWVLNQVQSNLTDYANEVHEWFKIKSGL